MRQCNLNVWLGWRSIIVQGSSGWFLHIGFGSSSSQLFQTASRRHLCYQLLSIDLTFHLAWFVWGRLCLLEDHHRCGLWRYQNRDSANASLDWVQTEGRTQRHLTWPTDWYLILTLRSRLTTRLYSLVLLCIILILLLLFVDSSIMMCTWPRIISICYQLHLRSSGRRNSTYSRRSGGNWSRLVDCLRINQETFSSTILWCWLLFRSENCLSGLLSQVWLLVVLDWT